MEWLVIVVLLVFIGGLAVVTIDALRHANKSSANNPIKPTR
jgi:cbb3-type cytochrome oxidase subunit 3